ncbi:PfkB family kinase, partial [Penicillium hispanicum]|uniref:PfkB family kinase n=1 Tax=Penicillium hispanicum TaxID=1080232 RepID=UPI0025416399
LFINVIDLAMATQDISFTSFGLVVLDEIRFPNREPLTNVLGGSGAYEILHSDVRQSLRSLGLSLVQLHPSGLLSIPKNAQADPSPAKDFKYTTPVLAPRESSLEGTALLKSRVYHYLASPQDITACVSNLSTQRKRSDISEYPLVIWEPAPLSCTPENLQACLDAASVVDVFSPNHLELVSLFAEPLSTASDKNSIERLALTFLDRGIGPDGKGTVIVRAGEQGCVIATRNLAPTWVPPFYVREMGERQNRKVIDSTGAGNAFLGAYAVGYLKTGNVVEAACYGSVGASFILEQVGVPEKTNLGDGELWNGVDVLSRLREYMPKCPRS